jgi:hypothetical protein
VYARHSPFPGWVSLALFVLGLLCEYKGSVSHYIALFAPKYFSLRKRQEFLPIYTIKGSSWKRKSN